LEVVLPNREEIVMADRAPYFGVLLALLLAAPAPAGAPMTYQGPTAYLSAADSPFDTAAAGFCLEDFEDGVLDTIGASGNGSIVAPGGITDSVDADDGTVDGSGNAGHSYFGSGPTGITITFDPGAPGGLPMRAGMVWTDGEGTISFEAFDESGGSLGVIGPFDHADGMVSGGTAEDRFYGVLNAAGVTAIKLTNTAGGIEIDHLQYDNCFGTPPTSTTTTVTTTTVTTTTTTLPGGCAGVPVGPTFASLNCRLAALVAAVQAQAQLGKLQAKLVKAAEKAKQRKETAEEKCAEGKTKPAGKQLKKVVRKLIQFSHRLRSKSARKKAPEEIREPLAVAADAIQQDARALRDELLCST
jgi:hypothetical protein